jgi:imidazole glycerol phosphate synthase glutamine amidotransferase subunit
LIIVRTGTANTASVVAAIERLGLTPRLTTDVALVRDAELAILPGVGAFGAAMDAIRAAGLEDVLRDRLVAGRATMCICLGLQVLCETSEETPGVRGLGVIPATIGRFADDVRVPQLGWNEVVPEDGCGMLTRGFAYYANSYRLASKPAGWKCAMTTHGAPFVAAVERGNVLACQFHPELSGPWGLGLIKRWVERSTTETQRHREEVD